MAPPPLRQYASTPALPSGQVTEDTPADLLEGDMNLTVILPAGHHVTMRVDRSTPMMDLLIQVTTAHKINPAGHIIHVVSDSRLVTYKPSTPIGRLDSSVIQIVAKNKANEEARARRAHLVAQAVEKNIRLKPKEYVFKQQLVVNLPRNQLAVYRVPPKTRLDDVLEMVCRDKSIDPATHEIRHPVNVDEKLRGSCTLADYQLQAVTVVPRDYHVPPLSVTDLLTMSAISNHHHGNHHSSTDGGKKRGGLLSLFTRKPKSSTGGSSLSSGSAGERSISPARSDHYIEPHNDPPPTLHDPPPPLQHSSEPPPSLRHSSSTSQLPRPLSMHSTSAPPQPQPQRPLSVVIPPRTRKRQAPAPPPPGPTPPVQSNGKDVSGGRSESHTSGYVQRSPQTSPAGSEVAGVTTNLTSVISTSSLSLASSRGKRKAPAPPQPPQPRSDPQPPIPEESEPPGPRSSTPDTPPGGHNGTPQANQSRPQHETKADPASEPQGPSSPESEPRTHSPSPGEGPDLQQGPKTQRTSSPTSSVSSLSSADPTPAPTSPILPSLPQPDPPHASGKPRYPFPHPCSTLDDETGEDCEKDWNDFLDNLNDILRSQQKLVF